LGGSILSAYALAVGSSLLLSTASGKLKIYGLGELGRILIPLFGLGELGSMLIPLFGLGELGSMLIPLFFVENASLAYEIARFVNAASAIVMTSARNLFSVVFDLMLTSPHCSYVRSSVTLQVTLRSLKYANLKLMSSTFLAIQKRGRFRRDFVNFMV
jgi:hypothetical protein